MTKIQSLSISKLFSPISLCVLQFTFLAILGIFITVFFAIFAVEQSKAAEALEIPALTAPSDGDVFSTPMPKITGTIQGVDQVLVVIDDVLNGTVDAVNRSFVYYPFLPLSSGGHTIQLRAKNSQTGEMSDYSIPLSIFITPNPAPTLLVPTADIKLGQDRAWVGGVAFNNSVVRVFVDNEEYARTNVKNHSSGVGSFGVNVSGLSLGEHSVTAIARDQQGKESFLSNAISITILPPTPAPTLNKPSVNTDSGIERPIISGNTKSGLVVSIVIDGKIVGMTSSTPQESGDASFTWQPDKALALGAHKIEVFASDNGKLSNNSKVALWQVGEEQDVITQKPSDDAIGDTGKVEGDEATKAEEPDEVAGVGGAEPEEQEPTGTTDSGGTIVESDKGELVVVDDKQLSVSEGEDDTKPLTVKSDLDEEEPVVPDVVIKPVDGVALPDEDEDTEGRIDADDENKLVVVDDTITEDDVDEITPGAVVRKDSRVDDDSEFKLNTSLIIGIVILVFLLLSILVWYIQEKRENLGQKVVDMFREEDEEGAEPQQEDGEHLAGGDEFTREDQEKDVFVSDASESASGDVDVRFDEDLDQELQKEEFKEDEFEWPEEPKKPEQYPGEEDDDSKRRPDDLPPPPPPMF